MKQHLVSDWKLVLASRRPASFLWWGLGILALGLCAGCGDSGPVDPCDPSLARSIVVDYEGDEATVPLGGLPGELEGERCLVSLDAVVLAANLGVDLQSAFVDLRADDGFQPSQVECALLPGATLSQGMVDRRTGFVFWPDVLDMRGCYFVQGLAAVLVRDASELP